MKKLPIGQFAQVGLFVAKKVSIINSSRNSKSFMVICFFLRRLVVEI